MYIHKSNMLSGEGTAPTLGEEKPCCGEDVNIECDCDSDSAPRTQCNCPELIRNSAKLLDMVADKFTDHAMRTITKLRAEIYRDVAEVLEENRRPS